MTQEIQEPIPFISLFSGAMGLDLGLEQAGFESKLALEIDADAVKTIRRNRHDLPVIEDSVVDVSGKDILEKSGLNHGEVPLLVGGPPCQAFSVIGKRRGIDDSRGRMVYEFIRLVNEVSPRAFVMENVRGILSMALKPKSSESATSEEKENGSLIKDVISKFEDIGYRVDCFVVNAVNYGAPQLRERVLLIGNRVGGMADFAQPTHSNRPEDNLPPFKTLGEVIGGDFEDPDPSLLNFSPRKLRYLSMVPEGGNWRSLPEDIQKESMGKSWYLKGGRSAYWRRLSFNFPSPTVVTMPNHAGTSMCHPLETRAISVGEAAAIQEFPRDWLFEGSAQSKFKQIGNAVPVRLGRVLGETLREMLATAEGMHRNTPSRIVHLRPHVRTRSFWKNGRAYAGNTNYYSKAQAETLPIDDVG